MPTTPALASNLFKQEIAKLAVASVNASHHATLALAVAAANSDSDIATIIVPPGTYNVTSDITLTRSNLYLFLAPGAIINAVGTFTTAVFNLDGSVTPRENVHIFGHGRINMTGIGKPAIRFADNILDSTVQGIRIQADGTSSSTGILFIGTAGADLVTRCGVLDCRVFGTFLESVLFQDTDDPYLDGGEYGDIAAGATGDVFEISNSIGGRISNALFRNPGAGNSAMDIFTRSGGAWKDINISNVVLEATSDIANTTRTGMNIGGVGTEGTIVCSNVVIRGIPTADDAVDANSFLYGYQTTSDFDGGNLIINGGSVDYINATGASEGLRLNGNSFVSLSGVLVNHIATTGLHAVDGIVNVTGGSFKNCFWESVSLGSGMMVFESNVRRYTVNGVEFDRDTAVPAGADGRQVIRTNQGSPFESGLIVNCTAHENIFGSAAGTNLMSNAAGTTTNINVANNYLRTIGGATVALDHSTTV